MVENAFENDCIIDCKELKKMQFRQNKLVRDRQKCKTHLKAAQNTLDEIEKDVGAKLLLYAGAALTTLCVGGVLRKPMVEELIKLLATGTAETGKAAAGTVAVGTKGNAKVKLISSAIGVTSLVASGNLFIACVIYADGLNEITINTQSKLNSFKVKFENICTDIKYLETQKELLDVVEFTSAD